MKPTANSPAAWDARASAPTSWQAAMWSEQSQDTRFNMACSWLEELVAPDEIVLDFGCGTGHLADAIVACGAPMSHTRYVGYDWSPAMRARARADQPSTRWPRFSILETVLVDDVFDHVVCLGPFNLSDKWTRGDTLDALATLWAVTRRSMIVSLYRGQEKTGMISYGLEDAKRIIERLGYPRFTFTTEHLGNDMMLRFLRR